MFDLSLLTLKITVVVPLMFLLLGVSKVSGKVTCWSANASGRLGKSIRLDPARKSLT